jgi:hypothetical protein
MEITTEVPESPAQRTLCHRVTTAGTFAKRTLNRHLDATGRPLPRPTTRIDRRNNSNDTEGAP